MAENPKANLPETVTHAELREENSQRWPVRPHDMRPEEESEYENKRTDNANDE